MEAKIYALLLKNEKRTQYDRIALFTILLNLGLFVYIYLNAGNNFVRYSALTGSALLFLSLIIEWKWKPGRNLPGEPFRFAGIYLIFIFWLLVSNWWAAACCLLVSLLYLAAKRPLIALFRTDFVDYPSFPRRQIEWKAIDSVILKDGLLTVNLKNDKFFQPELQLSEVDEPAFNEFCRQQLASKGVDTGAAMPRG